MKLATFPNVSLKCIEYLILSIQSNPGQSQRYHLKRWHQYKYNRPDHRKGGHNNGFFTSPSYRDIIWTDVAPQDVNYPSYYSRKKSKSAQMHLTYPGWLRANTVRAKLGLQSIEWGEQDLPSGGACKIYQTMV
jgi:hypothetical protein